MAGNPVGYSDDMVTPPADWEQQELFIGTERRFNVLANPGPYNLFGLKGDNARHLKRAWRGDPEDDPDILIRLQMWPSALTFFGFILVLTGVESGTFWSKLFQPTNQQWIGYALLVLGGLWLAFPLPRRRQQLAEAEQREKAARLKDRVTAELRLPGKQGKPTLMRRHRGMTPLWAEGSLSGRIYLTLEGLTTEEIEQILKAVSDLNPEP